ncbi:MAG: NusG domain II-containing protein [Clostridia bacterium]|nr:NusG domain II-containing protein [Clostridia bacterium]MDD4680382.1 NusG domain II-containing protein [Clostridia bacterium]
MKITFRRGDILVYLLIILLIVGSYAGLGWMGRGSQHNKVLVEVDGTLQGSYDLPTGSNIREILIDAGDGRYNQMILTSTGVSIKEASCPDQICVNWGNINKPGQTIVCLPHKVVIRIIGNQEGESPLDDISF